MGITAHINKRERSQISNLTLHPKEVEKEEQTKPKISRKKLQRSELKWKLEGQQKR